MSYISSQTVFRNAVIEVRVPCKYKCTASYRAQEQVDCARTAKTVVHAPAAFVWFYLYTYLFGLLCFTISILQKVVSNPLPTTTISRLDFCVRLFDLNIQYCSFDYVLLSHVTYSRSFYPN